MPSLVKVFSFVAVLALAAITWLFAGPRLPREFDHDGGNALAFGFFVYFVTALSLMACAAHWPQVREVFRSRFKVLFGISLGTITAYFAFISFVLYSLLTSTGL